MQVIAAARHVMAETLCYLEASWGSAHNYARAAGLSADEVAAIRRNLLDAHVPGLGAAQPAPCAAG